jgi:dihydrolipoamide dehydrogenase
VATDVPLPELGESVTEGVITAWLVKVGDTVAKDQPLVEISTDKVDTEIPSPVAGVVTALSVAVDDTVAVGATLLTIDDANGTPVTVAPDSDTAKDDTPSQTDTAAQPDTNAANGATKPAAETPAPADDSGAEQFDVVILGAGTGGYSAALRAAQLGQKVALIERAKVGGTCLHWGCIPTKALLQSAEVAETARDASEFGIKASFDGVEVAAVNAHKDSVVDKMWTGLKGALKQRGVETIHGDGVFTGTHTLTVTTSDGDRHVQGKKLVIATGSTPRELPFAPFDGDRVLSSDHALHLDKLPKSAIILGSGAVGMEFATAWSAFGVDVTLVELEDRLLPLEDADVSKEMARAYRKAGITTLTGVKITAVKTTKTTVTCTVEGHSTDTLKADLLLVAVGRRPVTENAGLDVAGVNVDERGFVTVDEYCRTNVADVYAVGDVIPTLGLAHASFAEGILVADHIAGEPVTPIVYSGVPRVTYSHPEAASVGLTEAQAKEQGFTPVIEKYSFQALGRAAIARATGMVKIVAAGDPDAPNGVGKILGIHIVGPRATDLIAEGQLIVNWEALPEEVAQLIHPHPSFAEALGEAHLALAGRALHG